MFRITRGIIKSAFREIEGNKGVTFILMLIFGWLPLSFCIIADIIWLPFNILGYLFNGERENERKRTYKKRNSNGKNAVKEKKTSDKLEYKKEEKLRGINNQESSDNEICELNIIKEKGYDINESKRIKFGHSPLISAVIYNDIDLVKELIEKGAKINLRNHDGDTALIVSLRCVNNKLQIFRELIKAGADVNIKNNEGSTALLLAIPFEKKEIIKELIKGNSDLNVKNNNGDNALLLATMFDKIIIIQDLLKSGIDVNVKNNEGTTALISAARYGKVEIVRELLSAGADVKIKDNNGFTALNYAIDNGNEVIINMLKDNN